VKTSSPSAPPDDNPPIVQKIVFKRALPYELQATLKRLKERCPFFTGMTEGEIAEVLRLCRRRTFASGEAVFQQGETGDFLYVILSGEVAVVTGDGENKREVRLGPGEVFGEMALLEDEPRSASVWALEESILLGASAAVLRARMPSLRSKVLENIALQLTHNLRKADRDITELQRLLHLCRTGGAQEASQAGDG